MLDYGIWDGLRMFLGRTRRNPVGGAEKKYKREELVDIPSNALTVAQPTGNFLETHLPPQAEHYLLNN